MAARTPQRQRLVELLDPVISSAGYELEDLTVSAAGRRSLVRVVVDRDGGVDLDAIADLSRDVSAFLDDCPATDAVLNGPFVLEVSSPGVDRPLTRPGQWRRSVGRLVSADVGSGMVTGRVVAADEQTVVLLVGETRRDYALADLGPGHIQVEFSHPERDDAGADDGAGADDEDDDAESDGTDQHAEEV